ncbi:MAG: sigma-E factor negative regulatory protein [Burkholderiaceae bacterium]
MPQDYDADHQLVSALADGELRGEEFSQALELLGHSEQAVAAWRLYHVVGDALRGADMAITHREQAFVERIRAQLDGVAIACVQAGAEPQVLPQLHDGAPARAAANDQARRWKWLAAAASVAAVAAIGWPLLGVDSSAPVSAKLSAQEGAQLGAAPNATSGVMLRDPRLDELMAAHKQFGGISALQMPSGFLRNATFDGPAAKDAR